MLVRTEPERLHGGHPELGGAAHVLVKTVTDEDGVGRRDPERVQSPLEDRRMRLARADL